MLQNVEATRLMNWAVEENNRIKGQKIMKAAEKMEKAYSESRGLPYKGLYDAYKLHWALRRRRAYPPKQ